MKKNVRSLTLGFHGDDVLHLKIKFSLLGFETVFSTAINTINRLSRNFRLSRPDLFDAATAKAVRELQEKVGLPATGTVDEATAALIETLLEETDRYAVYGFVKGSDDPVDGVVAKAFDRDLKNEQELGKSVTRMGGFYVVPYERASFSRAEKLCADLVVRVHDANGGAPLTADEATHFNAGRVHRIDVALDAGQCDLPSEYERYLADLTPVLQKVALRKLTDENVTFLHHDTGIPVDRLNLLRLDDAFRYKSGLGPSVFYGLLRQGLPATRQRLLAERPSRLEGALKASMERNIIPRALAGKLDETLEILRKLATEAAFAKTSPDDRPGLGQVLLTGAVARDQAVRFVDFAPGYEGKAAEFWDAARIAANLDDKAVGAIRFTLVAGAYVSGHLKTLKILNRFARSRGWQNDPRKIAGLTRETWRRLTARTGHPAEFDTSADFADAIADRIESADPTAVVAARLAGDPDIAGRDVPVFLDANPEFDLLNTRVDDYLSNGARLDQLQDPEGMRKSLLTLQSVARIAPEHGRYEAMAGLIRNGYTSPGAIMRSGSAKFIETMTPHAGKTAVTDMLANARVRAEAAEVVVYHTRDYTGDGVRVLPGMAPDAEVDIPDWARLFGSLSGCACEHCRSLYSPAAYLVDLLQFLRDVPPGGDNALAVLRERRPDIEHIDLNCANATIALPYIDLVNEILEVEIAGAGSVDWRDYQTPKPNGETQAEIARRLRAEPQHELAAAYDPLIAAEYPWTLPFGADQERVWLFARHLGLDLSGIRALFGRDEGHLAKDALNLSQAEWDLMARPVEDVDLNGIWGTSNPEDLEQVPVFMRQSALSYDELRGLTESWFLSADGLVDVAIVPFDGSDADPCDLAAFRLEGLRDESGNLDRHVVDQLHRFLRLRAKLDWPVGELDGVLAALGRSQIDGETIKALARAKRLADDRGLATRRLVEATGPAFANLLGLAEAELAVYVALLGAGDVASLDAMQRLAMIEAWPDVPSSGFGLPELTYVLLGRDQVPPAFEPSDEGLTEFLRALHALVQDQVVAEGLSTAQVEELVVENVAAFQNLDREVCDRLIRPLHDAGTGAEIAAAAIAAESDSGDAAMVDLAYFVAIAAAGGAPDEVEPAAYDNAAGVLRRLDRPARLLRRHDIDRRELDVILSAGSDNGFLVLDPGAAGPPADRFAGWRALVGAKQVQAALPRGDHDLFDFIAMAADAGATDAQFFAALNAATGWSVDPATREVVRDAGGSEVDIPVVLAAAMGFDRAAFGLIESYDRLDRAVQALRRWRIAPETLIAWSDPSQPVSALADSLHNTARARHRDDEAWYDTLAPLMDFLRERKRDALLSFLISRDRLDGPAAVYERFLIDPEMSSCMLTSRIKQANASIQLFAQRIQMNLEGGLRPTAVSAEAWHAHWRQWEWRRNYRVWEANRKVFLYPESTLR